MNECMEIDKQAAVSVIVLTYGNFERLSATLDSICIQHQAIDKIIVSDDGSNCEFSELWMKKYPQVVFRKNSHNVGTVQHMNITAGLLNSKYIKYLGAGDEFWDQNSLRDMVKFAEKSDSIVCIFQSKVYTPFGEARYCFPGIKGLKLHTTPHKAFRVLAIKNIVSAVATIFRCDFFTDQNGFDTSYRYLEDWPTWLRLSRENYSLSFKNQIVCKYFLSGVSAQNLDAYHSRILRDDMICCYEKEILPYLHMFSLIQRRKIQFSYDMLCGYPEEKLRQEYGFFYFATVLKREIKRWIIR